MMLLFAPFLALLLVAGCGNSDATPSSAGTGDVSAKAVADVDAAMADAQRTRTAPPGSGAAPRSAQH